MVLCTSLSFFSSTCVLVCSAISVLSGERCIHEVWREHVASLVGKWVALPPLLFAHHRYFSTTADAAAVGLCRFVSILSRNTNTSRELCATLRTGISANLLRYSAAIPASASRPPRAHQLFMASLFPLPIHWPPTFLPFPPVRLPTATLEPNNHLPKPKSLGPSVRSVRPFWFEITVPSSHNSLLPLD